MPLLLWLGGPALAVPVTVPSPDTCHATFTEDQRLDGIVDASGYQEYDPLFPDRLLWTEKDADLDGDIDQSTAYGYDDRGNRISSDDRQPERGFRSLTSWTYDSGDHLIEYRYDGNADGKTDSHALYDWDGDRMVRIVTDKDGNGLPETSVEIDYDPLGREVERTTLRSDGQRLSQTLSYYDSPGRLVLQVMDTDADGTPNTVIERRYVDPISDAEGQVLIDYGNDEVVDQVQTFRNGPHGQEYATEDTNADGTDELVREWTWDPVLGTLLATDIWRAGSYDRTEYGYDALGREIHKVFVGTNARGAIWWSLETVRTFGGLCP